MNLKILIFLFINLLTKSLVGQDVGSTERRDSSTLIALEEVVVSGNRIKSLRLNTPEAILVIGNKAIQSRQLRTTPEALMLSPGVFVQKTNHGGGSAFLRGLTGNQTLLLIDGIRLSNATMRYGPNQYLNTIDVFSIERIEILRGSGSVQYGSDAIGGTIQAFTRELSFSDHTHVNGSLAGRMVTQGMEQSLHADATFSAKSLALRVGTTCRKFGDLVGGDTTGRQTPTGYRELDFDTKAKILLSPTATLTMAYQQVYQKDVPVYHKIVLEHYSENIFEPQKRKLAYARLNYKLTGNLVRSIVLTGSWQHTEEGRVSRKSTSQVRRTENDRLRSLSLSAEALTSKGTIWSANSGIELYHDRVNSSRMDTDLASGNATSSRGLYPDGASMLSLAAFTLHTFDLPKWIITAGTRWNFYIINMEDVTLGRTRITPSALVGNLAAMRKLADHSNLFVSVNSGFRAPNIDDLGTLGIVDFRYEKPNLHLKPEHSLQYQIGYKYQDKKLGGEFYLYRNELYNLIVRNKTEGEVIEGYPVYLKENIERAYILGAETTWNYAFNRSWSVNGTFTYTYGQNITRNEPLRRIPPFFGSAGVQYTLKNLRFNLEWMTAGKQDRLAAGDLADNRIPYGGTPGWNLINIHANYSWHLVTLNLSLQNLFNTDYRYHGSGVNGYGRSLWVTLEVAINNRD